MQNKPLIAVTRLLPMPALDKLNKVGILNINEHDKPLSKEELLRIAEGAHAIISQVTDVIDADVMDSAGSVLKIIANYAVGYDNIDLKAAEERNITVTNTPGALTDATADLAWALLFSAARRVAEGDRFTRDGKFQGWGPMLMLGCEITGKTLGVVGAGRIGFNFAVKSSGFKMKVLYTDQKPNAELEAQVDARFVDLQTLLKESDFVSLHVPLTAQTRHLIGASELALMKPTAVLINTSRGPVVDERALVEALRHGRIFSAGLDVYENEPLLTPGLQALDNVVLLPHLGSATLETRTRMAMMAVENVTAVLENRAPLTPVNRNWLSSS